LADKILYNGEISDKFINISTESLFFNYGYGLFETILYDKNGLMFYNEHINRLVKSLNQLGKIVNLDDISEQKIVEYIESTNIKSEILRVKILVIGDGKENLSTVVQVYAYERKNKDFEVWIDFQVKDLEISNYKSINYMQNLLRREFFNKKYGVDEVLFLNVKNRVLEGSFTNIAVILNNNIYFVEKRENYLDGIMQQQVEKNFKGLGFKKVLYKRRGFSTKMLRQCDEIILLNSLQIATTVSKIYNKKKQNIITPKSKNYSERIRTFFLS